ncbi:MAG: hypothetical protein IJJ64_12895 [Butyrivibrio sp.]|nr:hypothetical protein [Butyrivibrio sp.]
MSKEETSTRKSGKGGIRVVVIGILVIIAILVGIIVVLVSKLEHSTDVEQQEKKSVITAENVEEVLDDMEDLPDHIPKNYTVKQSSDWVFSDGSSESTNAYVENSTDNETPIYFDLQVDGTGEIVYSSPILDLGAKIQNFALDVPLEKGIYECTVIYHLIDDDQNELTHVNVGVNVEVEN